MRTVPTNSMNYKGFEAEIRYDPRDQIFVGRLVGHRALISFHGETDTDLRLAFEMAVEEYITDLSEQGTH
jgi:predicted HicB family RNase H-like nuclease